MKRKTPKELERELRGSKKVGITLLYICIFLAALLIIISVVAGLQKSRFLDQLSECQNKVPIWTLKVYCNSFFDYAYGKVNSTIIIQGEGYKDYERVLGYFKEQKNCEVLD